MQPLCHRRIPFLLRYTYREESSGTFTIGITGAEQTPVTLIQDDGWYGLPNRKSSRRNEDTGASFFFSLKLGRLIVGKSCKKNKRKRKEVHSPRDLNRNA